MMMATKFSHYDRLRDRVTGYSGIVMGITYYATGCFHYGLCPASLDKDGKVQAWEWFDESRLILVEDVPAIPAPNTKPTSGPEQNPPCMN